MEDQAVPEVGTDASGGGPTDRRAFLRRAGIGAGVAGAAWAAPSILTLDAAYAAGTCPAGTSTFNWNTATNLTLANTAGKVGATTSANIDIRIVSTAQNGVVNNGLAWNNWRTRSGTGGQIDCGGQLDYPMGNTNTFYSLEMAADAADCTGGTGTAGRWVEVVFGFFDAGTTTPHAVRNLGFSLLDVDTGANNNYIDQVEIFLNGSATPATTGAGNNFTTATRGANVSQPNAGVARFRGTANTANTSTASNVTLNSNPGNVAANNISQLRIRFTDMNNPRPTTIQWVGISNFTFCKV